MPTERDTAVMAMRNGINELLRQLARNVPTTGRTFCLEVAEAGAASSPLGGLTWPHTSNHGTQQPSSSPVWQHGPQCSCSACSRHGAACSCPACTRRTGGATPTTSTRQAPTCNCHACTSAYTARCSCPSCRSSKMYSYPAHTLQQVRTMACSAGLGRAPPQQVVIEYDPEDVDAYIEVADALEQAFPNIVVLGNEQADGRKGSFEVTTSDGYQVFSKLKEHQYPKLDDLVARITNRAALNPEVLGSADAAAGRFCT